MYYLNLLTAFSLSHLNLPKVALINYLNLAECITWIYLKPCETTWIYLNSFLELAWMYSLNCYVHLSPKSITWIYCLKSPNLLEFITWIDLKSPEMSSIYLNLSPEFTWIYHLNLPEFITWIYHLNFLLRMNPPLHLYTQWEHWGLCGWWVCEFT